MYFFSTAKVNAAPNVVRDGDYAQLKLINIFII